MIVCVGKAVVKRCEIFVVGTIFAVDFVGVAMLVLKLADKSCATDAVVKFKWMFAVV